MTTENGTPTVSYEQFRKEWLAEIEDDNLSPLDRGRRFAAKLVTQWLGVTTDDEDFVVCDGSGDGGIDIAYLKRADIDQEKQDDNALEGDTWYLVQSKYGTSFAGSSTILEEGNKVIATLTGQNQRLAQDSQQLLQKLDVFRQQASDADRIVLVLATTDPISQQDRAVLDNVKIIGRERITSNFDVEEVSIHSVWETLVDVEPTRLSVDIKGRFVEQSSGLLVGTVSLLDLFDFMQAYQKQTGDLNQLYEKNVRQFLGGRRKVNRGITETLTKSPEKFGLYNNGITFVVSGYSNPVGDSTVKMHDPYVVNGCQTTKTIWQVLDIKLNAGGRGIDSATSAWKEQVARGGVVTKIVRSDEAEITNITWFTNSQNSVRPQDFVALNSGFQGWAAEMEKNYNIFLEIQRGGTEARKAREKQHPDQPRFDDYVNAFDLIKVYGAGWMAAPGPAFGKNAPFLPRGSIYERIIRRQDGAPAFGARDLYAAYKVKCVADAIGFGRKTAQASRRQSRFLFYYVIIEMLKETIILTPELQQPTGSVSDLTDAMCKLATPAAKDQLDVLSNSAITLIDQYLTFGSENSAHKEISFVRDHNGDMNAFLKAEGLGRTDHSPLLVQALAVQKAAFNMAGLRERTAQALLAG